MMTTVNYAGFGLVALCLCSSGAMCADRLVGEVALTPAHERAPWRELLPPARHLAPPARDDRVR